ncbi:Ketosamine-3-kinase [Sistotremastrum niveocremeum HHB9708]|uniref:protein-ribulosamine 3-kinase n=2 Tax=Sistotremastraceae TaxID=3402574 RepID=A0A164XDF1_9AGAM|nr:Ketosamine-3-kinase [Sistotremastrum niveocremeum HHB9708]KZT41417.1 Ketosamine-3-kinase [Sistotremastrum suecicum HHB10207 ss-3]
MTIAPIFLRKLREMEPDSDFTSPKYGNTITSSSGAVYFCKKTTAASEQFTGEAESLRLMYDAAPGLCPKLFACGDDEESGETYFISEYLRLGHGLSDTAANTLAKRMAEELHKGTSETRKFGFGCPSYCGATRLNHGWFDTWEECYSSMIKELLDHLRDKSASRYSETLDLGEKLRERVIPALLNPLEIQPSLLHGDLWSGNVGVDTGTDEPVIFDPASFYGHNEADLAITRMFGGFPNTFYETYHEHFPKSQPEEQYQLRTELYEVFHYLNHTVLFGSGYEGQAQRLMKNLLKSVDPLQ